MTIFDSHTHIHFPDYDKDRDEVIKRARAAGVKMITVGTDYQTSQDAIAIAEKYPDDIWATVGIHPTEIGSEKWEVGKWEKLARHPKVAAIGECGLDYFRIKNQEASIKDAQKQLFVEQIKLAQELNKPLMIHCRPSLGTNDAYEDLITVIASPEGESVIASPRPRGGEAISVTDKRIAASPPALRRAPRNDIVAIVHFFAGSPDIAKQLLELGCYFTFGGVITFSRDYDEVIKFLPLEKIMLETDAPYVAPVPYRGKRNEPVYVVEVAKKMAEIKGISYEEITRQTTGNAKRIFRI